MMKFLSATAFSTAISRRINMRWMYSSSLSTFLLATSSGWHDRLESSRQNHQQRAPFRLSAKPSSQSVEDETNQSGFRQDYATNYHAPVMCLECVNALLACQRTSSRIFVDGTLGGGGHSMALLEKLQAGDIVLGCDVDSNALETASKRLSEYMNHDASTKPLFVPVETNFGDLITTLPQVMHPLTNKPILEQPHSIVDGILLDFGVSSHQIDTPERGFAFLHDGPLDMRMSAKGGITAADICNEFSIDELKRILKHYGDEPRSKVIAQSIIRARPLTTTQDLVEAVATVVPQFAKQGRRQGRTATLARVFQALRIVVNREDVVLTRVLEEACPTLIRPGGRLVVLSYHSLEDGATKRIMRDGTTMRPMGVEERDIYGNYIGTPKPFKSVGKPQKASDVEVEANSRARSATLRVAERLDHDNDTSQL
jgi:16S rRNA (cytosine1402-N4)-methyltransferase